MVPEVTLDFTTADGRGRVRGWMDTAPRLDSLNDGIDPLPDFWRQVIEGLLRVLDESTGSAPANRPACPWCGLDLYRNVHRRGCPASRFLWSDVQEEPRFLVAPGAATRTLAPADSNERDGSGA